jgi:predicted nucleic acid-binding protein
VAAAIAESREALVVPITILPELDYLVATRLGSRVQQSVLQAFLADEFRIENLSRADLERSLDLVTQYADNAIGLVDASIVAIAERLRVTRVLTLDRRHFERFRPRHCSAFEIVP